MGNLDGRELERIMIRVILPFTRQRNRMDLKARNFAFTNLLLEDFSPAAQITQRGMKLSSMYVSRLNRFKQKD
jgi:hypothetical protein